MIESTNFDHAASAVTGWDIGGVNLKAARLNSSGVQVLQRPFAIWQHVDELTEMLTAMAAELGPAHVAGVTMTAELSDAFRTKREGVRFVLDAVRAALPDGSIRVFGIDGQFHTPAVVYNSPLLAAAANWMATALLVARHVPTCVVVDVGSTTTDVIPIVDERVVAGGRNDPERLLQNELLYTGALRTPVFAIVQRVPLWDRWCPVAAEHFASAQDVHLILGNLSPDECASPTADGRPATPGFAVERLARVVCADIQMVGNDDIRAIAECVADEQIRQIAVAINRVLSRTAADGPIVATGVGAFLVRAAAEQLGVACMPLADMLGDAASIVAPAAAVALLLAEQVNVRCV